MNPDVQFQVECLTRDLIVMLAEEYGWDSEKAMDTLYQSETFARLEDERSGLYYQSPVYVFDILKHEIETGRVN